MARGRGGSYEPGVVTITRRRHLSLEPDIELRGTRKAQMISDYANDDTDLLSTRSRNKDRELLKDITTRMVQTNGPSYVDASLPLTRTTSTTTRRRVVTPTPYRILPESALFIRAGSVPPSRSRVDFYDEDYPISTPLPPTPPPQRRFTPVRTRVTSQSRPIYRAASEPPPYFRSRPIYRAPSEPVRPPPPAAPTYSRYPRPIYRAPSEPTYLRSQPVYSSYYETPLYTSPYRQVYIPPSEPYDYTTYYYPPRVAPPYYGYNGNRNTRMTPSTSEAVRAAHRHLDRIEREIGVENGPVIAEPVVIHHMQSSPRVVPRHSARLPPVRGALPRARSSSLPPSAMGASRSSRIAAIEDFYDGLLDDVDVTPTIRPYRPSDIASNVSTAASRPYRPADITSSVEYTSLSTQGKPPSGRMPALDRNRPFQGSVTSAGNPVTPYRVASTYNKPPSGSTSGLPPRTNFRPKVSDTRKRIREVLCATKKDPHYFD